MAVKFEVDEKAFRKVTMAVAAGLLACGHYVEGEAKAITPVHGDGSQGGPYKTRVPGKKPIGGTLRRSIHTVCILAGRIVFGTGGVDKNKNRIPSYVTGANDIVVIVGTNIEYAAFVHDGTVKMKPARPFLSTASERSKGVYERLFSAAFKRHIQ